MAQAQGCVKLLLVADKPALCHVLGRRSFAHDYFSPHCRCSEKKGQLNDFSRNPLTHYDDISFKERCALALVPLHEALGLPEPADWTVTNQGTVPPAAPLTHTASHATRRASR